MKKKFYQNSSSYYDSICYDNDSLFTQIKSKTY